MSVYPIMKPDSSLIIFLLITYLVCAIPFGLILTKLAGYGDVRKLGSGNIGATNVARTGNKKLAATVFFLDGMKGLIFVLIARDDMTAALAAMIAVTGHVFPVYLAFKGGKGVATSLFCLSALSWKLTLIGFLVWVAIFSITRISSISSLLYITTVVLFCLYDPIYFSYNTHLPLVVIYYFIIILFRHIENIKKLLQGKELKINEESEKQNGKKKK